jgi:hypothetical protein
LKKSPAFQTCHLTIEFEGRTVTGIYTVRSGVITLSTAMGTKATQLGGSASPAALDGLAKRLLREFGRRKGKAYSPAYGRLAQAVCALPSPSQAAKEKWQLVGPSEQQQLPQHPGLIRLPLEGLLNAAETANPIAEMTAQAYASRSGETRRTEHEEDACMANFRLVQERIAFDNNKRDSRGPEAEAVEPCAHSTRW